MCALLLVLCVTVLLCDGLATSSECTYSLAESSPEMGTITHNAAQIQWAGIDLSLTKLGDEICEIENGLCSVLQK